MAESPVNPAAIPIDKFVRTLRTAGSTSATEESIRKQIADGAPTNSDGTINLLNYAAWFVGEMGYGKRGK